MCIRDSNYPVWDDIQGRVVRFFGSGRDVTEEKIAQIQQARFITNAMHELSHPVSSILLRLYLMRRQPERLQKHLDALQPVADQIKRMIEDMREVSYLEQGVVYLQKERVALHELMGRVVEAHREAARERQIDLEYRAADTPLYIEADPHRIEQAFANLLGNSINMTPEGQRIVMDLYPEQTDEMAQAVLRLRHHRLLIDLDHPTMIFRAFHRASEGRITHTGLELMITREIIRLHGGEATVMVDDEMQSVFYIRLPLIHSSTEGFDDGTSDHPFHQ